MNSLRHHLNKELFFQEGFFLRWNRGQILVAWGSSRRERFPQEGKISCYIPDFYMEEERPWCIFEQGGLFEEDDPWQDSGEPPKRSWQEPQWEKFSQVFKVVKNQIHTGKLDKAVPIVFAESEGKISESEKKRALRQDPSFEWPKLYGWWCGEEGLLGCTPELLFAYESKRIKTMALAGTKTPGGLSLLDDPKECLEHQWVVRSIYNNLEPIGFVHMGSTYEWDSGLIQHLRTDIEATVKGDPDFNKLCELMHPTPALGISSRTLHWKWLKKIEPSVPRKRFGAPFGAILPDGRAQVLVAIRNIQWFGGKSYLGSGCGIVELSEPHREWKELAIKRKSVLQSLGME